DDLRRPPLVGVHPGGTSRCGRRAPARRLALGRRPAVQPRAGARGCLVGLWTRPVVLAAVDRHGGHGGGHPRPRPRDGSAPGPPRLVVGRQGGGRLRPAPARLHVRDQGDVGGRRDAHAGAVTDVRGGARHPPVRRASGSGVPVVVGGGGGRCSHRRPRRRIRSGGRTARDAPRRGERGLLRRVLRLVEAGPRPHRRDPLPVRRGARGRAHRQRLRRAGGGVAGLGGGKGPAPGGDHRRRPRRPGALRLHLAPPVGGGEHPAGGPAHHALPGRRSGLAPARPAHHATAPPRRAGDGRRCGGRHPLALRSAAGRLPARHQPGGRGGRTLV
ncbi:MAG: hypothetical protein AVDCRST_MAG20-35, partial [uncultured Acidimicrobiales bacterium]